MDCFNSLFINHRFRDGSSNFGEIVKAKRKSNNSKKCELQEKLDEAIALLKQAEWSHELLDHGEEKTGCYYCNQPDKGYDVDIHNSEDYPGIQSGEHVPDCPLKILLAKVAK